MNILVCSAGRRVKIVQYIKTAIQNRKVIAADCDSKASALFFADDYELIPRIEDDEYLPSILALCEKHNIDGVISLIDPELELLSKNKEMFDEIGVTLILSPLDVIQYSFDKQETYNYLSQIDVPAVPTYSDLETVESLLDNQGLDFPLIVKP